MDIDGVLDVDFGCPLDLDKIDSGACGCGAPETADGDGNGVAVCNQDLPQASTPGGDADSDGVEDCFDLCPDTAADIEIDPSGCPLVIPSGDCDQSGLVDLADFSDFKDCFAGPASEAAAGCACADLDDDGDVDLLDFADNQVYFGGPLGWHGNERPKSQCRPPNALSPAVGTAHWPLPHLKGKARR